jgi:serine/threonine protein kinase
MKTNDGKYEKINKIAKTILSNKICNSSIKQKKLISSNSKKSENNNSLLLKKNLKQNKLNINKKLNLIKETNESIKVLKYSENQRNTYNRQLITGSSKSYIMEESTKTPNVKVQKNHDYNKSLLLKKYSLQTEKPIPEKLSQNNRFRQSKSTTKDMSLSFYPKKPKQKLINNNLNNLAHLKKVKSKLNNRFNLKKTSISNPTPEDIFIFDENKPITLTKDEQVIYGDRTMKGYSKIKLLGKGGYGVVWACKKNLDENMQIYAVKQTSKKNVASHLKEDILQISKNEINVLKKLNEDECDLIPKIYETYEDSSDIWFSFEKGGISLSSLSFNIKGIFEKGERIYQIQKGEFLIMLFKNLSQFKFFVKKIIEGIDYINKKGIIHSDIKPENILVQFNINNEPEKNLEINSVKIVDYGSAFYLENKSPLITNTPEYLCPEIMTNNKDFIKEINNGNYINSIDIWSFGISLLELCLCCPIWMSYKTKNVINGKINYSMGYFGCKGRDENKIYQKQIDLSKNLNKILKNSLIYMFDEKNKNNFVDLLGKMLCFDYTKRITTQEALNHPFFSE